MKKSAAVAIIIAVIALVFAANPEYFNNLDESGRRVLVAIIIVTMVIPLALFEFKSIMKEREELKAKLQKLKEIKEYRKRNNIKRPVRKKEDVFSAVVLLISAGGLLFFLKSGYFQSHGIWGIVILIALIPVLVISIRTIKQKIDENIEESYREIQKKK